ncbi:MAG: MlaD family protein [Acidobacteriota bacterium]
MPRTRSVAWSEVKIGAIGITAVALVMLLIVAVGGASGFWWQRYPLKARFNNVQGLKAGAVVRVSGKEVGSVKSVAFSGPQVEVGIEVLKDVQALITTTSVAKIGSLSLLGDSILEISAGTGGNALQANDYVAVEQSNGGMADLTSSASASLGEIQKLLTDVRAGKGTLGKIVTDEALYTEMQAFVASAANVTRQINEGKGTLGGLVKDPAAYESLKASLGNLQAITARINSGDGALGRLLNDEAMGRSLSASTSNIESVTGRLSRGEGTAGKLLTDQQLYDRLNGLVARVDQVVVGLEAGRGTAGKLLHDQQLYENMNRAVVELQNLLSAISKDPQRYLRLKVSIF